MTKIEDISDTYILSKASSYTGGTLTVSGGGLIGSQTSTATGVYGQSTTYPYSAQHTIPMWPSHVGASSLSSLATTIDGGMVIIPSDIILVLTKDGEIGERQSLTDLLTAANIRATIVPSRNAVYVKAEVWDAICLLQSMFDSGAEHIDSVIFLRNTVAGMAEKQAEK